MGWALQAAFGVPERGLVIQATAPFPRKALESRPLFTAYRMAHLHAKSNLLSLFQAIHNGDIERTSGRYGVAPERTTSPELISNPFAHYLEAFSGASGYPTVRLGRGYARGGVGILGPDSLLSTAKTERWAHVFWLDQRDHVSPGLLATMDRIQQQMFDLPDTVITLHKSTPQSARSSQNNEDPSFSPDGRHIMFISDRTGTKQIYIVNVDGSNERRITTDTANYFRPKWLHKVD